MSYYFSRIFYLTTQSVAKSIQRRIAELSVKNKSKNMKKEQVWFEVSPGIRRKPHTGQQFSRPWFHQATSIPFDLTFVIGTTYPCLVVQYYLITLFSPERILKWLGNLRQQRWRCGTQFTLLFQIVKEINSTQRGTCHHSGPRPSLHTNKV
jgi:hypothetical protein